MKSLMYKKKYMIYLLLIIVTTIQSCGEVMSKHPLTDPIRSKLDNRIVGSWIGEIKDRRVIIHFGRKDNHNYKVLLIEYDKDASFESFEFSMFTTVIESEYYMNLQLQKSSIDINNYKDFYTIVKYKITDEKKLYVYLFDSEKIEHLQNKGVLKRSIENNIIEKKHGYSTKILENFILINEPPKELRRFLSNYEGITFKIFGVFSRLE